MRNMPDGFFTFKTLSSLHRQLTKPRIVNEHVVHTCITWAGTDFVLKKSLAYIDQSGPSLSFAAEQVLGEEIQSFLRPPSIAPFCVFLTYLNVQVWAIECVPLDENKALEPDWSSARMRLSRGTFVSCFSWKKSIDNEELQGERNSSHSLSRSLLTALISMLLKIIDIRTTFCCLLRNWNQSFERFSLVSFHSDKASTATLDKRSDNRYSDELGRWSNGYHFPQFCFPKSIPQQFSQLWTAKKIRPFKWPNRDINLGTFWFRNFSKGYLCNTYRNPVGFYFLNTNALYIKELAQTSTFVIISRSSSGDQILFSIWSWKTEVVGSTRTIIDHACRSRSLRASTKIGYSKHYGIQISLMFLAEASVVVENKFVA